MSHKVYKGEVKGKIVEVRFALSGKVVKVAKKKGQRISKGSLMASLDRTLLQTELDRQLSDYEKVRADFEIFNLQKGEPKDEITKYLKTEKQAQLNASVKEVELAKARVDQADLFSPVEGLILDDSCLISGLYITPASSSYQILDLSSFYFEIKISQKEISFFKEARKGEIEIDHFKEKIVSETSMVLSSEKGFFVFLDLSQNQDLFYGLKGKVTFKD